MIVTRKTSDLVRLLCCVACLTAAAASVSAQDRFVPPGYRTDMNEYWAPSGRIPQVLRPTPPGYMPTPDGGLVFDPPAPYARPYSRSCGCFSQWMAFHQQEKESFCMYIRGYGPAIHTRPGSVHW